MGNYEYLVTISNEDNMIRGNLQKVDGGDQQADFIPLTVLGDLLKIVTYTGTSPHPQDNYSLNEDYNNHPFFLGLKYKGNPLFQEPFGLKHFFIAVNELNEIITNDKHISMSEFEILKQFLSLKFTYEIEFGKINPLYELGCRENPINHEIVQKYQYLPLQYTYDYDMNLMFGDNNESVHKFTYTCYKAEDIMFSVLHYLVLLKYKFRKCEHCGNYFATKTFKEKYCTRKSPYTYIPSKSSNPSDKNPKNYECDAAVDLIKNRIRSTRKSLCKKLTPNDDYTNPAYQKFSKECEPYQDIIKKQASVNNLELFERFLDKKKEEIRSNKKRPPKSR
jgi:hypothetical protein